MSGSADNSDAETLVRDEFLHRALLRKRLINEDTSQIKPEAFLRRRSKDNGQILEAGLSVDRASLRPVQDFALSFKVCYGVIGIYAGEVKDAGLDVVPEATPPNAPSHAEVVDWPEENDPDFDAKEERLMGLLARKAQQVWRP